MNEKSNPMPMMYKTIPAVAELNKVPGFDPLKFLRHKVSRKTNEEMLQLELPYQKLWFRLRHPQGRMKLTTLRITEQLAIMEARVYLDRSDAEPISSYISQHSAEEGTDYVQAAQDEALSAALSDAGFGLQFADVAVDSTGKVFGSSIPLSGTAPIQQPMPNAAQRPVEAPGAALRQSGGEVHARPERAPQNAVEGRNAPARPAPIQKPAAKPVQNEQPPVSPVQPVVQQMVAEEKENMDTLPAGKVEENAPNSGKPVTSEKPVLFLESIYTFGLNDIEKEEVMKLAVSLTTQKAAELGVVAVLARRYLGCYERDEYVLAPFYVYISKSKNGWQYLDSLGGAAYTSAKEEYVEHPFLVIQTAMHHAGAHNRNEVDYE